VLKGFADRIGRQSFPALPRLGPLGMVRSLLSRGTDLLLLALAFRATPKDILVTGSEQVWPPARPKLGFPPGRYANKPVTLQTLCSRGTSETENCS
jgi:hypothetical protein